MLIQLLALGFAPQKQIELPNKSVHKLVGKGPPVVFSSGLYGTMPSLMYNQMLDNLKKKFTIILPNNKPITQKTIGDITKVLNVDNVGFLSHSSIDPGILESEFIKKAVCIDPVSLPSVGFPQIRQYQVQPVIDVLVIKTTKSQEAAIPFIPEGFNLEIQNACDIAYNDIGHADILDNFWADMAKRVGIKGLNEFENVEKQSFKDWTFNSVKKEDNRKKYRDLISNDIISHFSPTTEKLVSVKHDSTDVDVDVDVV